MIDGDSLFFIGFFSLFLGSSIHLLIKNKIPHPFLVLLFLIFLYLVDIITGYSPPEFLITLGYIGVFIITAIAIKKLIDGSKKRSWTNEVLLFLAYTIPCIFIAIGATLEHKE